MKDERFGDFTSTMALRQKLAAFLETRELKELKDTPFDVIFEFMRGELKKRRFWKFIVVTELMFKKYSILVPKNSVDRVEGSYVEKTKHIRDCERELAESLLETLEFRMATDELHVSADMLNPHAYVLIEWIMYGNKSIADKGTRCDEPSPLHPEGFTTHAYEGYRMKTFGNTVLECSFLNHD